MKLTMEACSQIDATCDQLKQISALEEFNDILAEVSDIQRNVKMACNTLETLDNMRKSLLACGYSDEWFDQIRMTPGIEGLVEFDMHKFFGGVQSRQEVCMEAFSDSVKRWIENVWKFVQWLYKKVMDAINWFLDTVGRKSRQMSAFEEEMWRRAEPHMQDYFGVKAWNLENFYDLDVIEKQLTSLERLISILYTSQGAVNVSFVEQGTEDMLPKDAKSAFFKKMVTAAQSNNLDYSNPAECGFEFRMNGSSNQMVWFYGSDKKDWPKKSVSIDSKQTIDVLHTQIKRGINPQFDRVKDQVISCRMSLTTMRNSFDTFMKNFDRSTGDLALYDEVQCKLIQYNCSLCIVIAAMGFLNNIENRVSANMKALVDVLKDIKDYKPGYQKMADRFN